jgi:hypothetical protein
MDPVADLKGKEIKRATLNEIVDYITAGRGVLTEPVYQDIIRMVSVIVTIPPSDDTRLLQRQFSYGKKSSRKCQLSYVLWSAARRKKHLRAYYHDWRIILPEWQCDDTAST